MPAPREIDPRGISAEDQQFENALRAARDFFQTRPAIDHTTAPEAGNPMTEDSFERARKAFFKNRDYR